MSAVASVAALPYFHLGSLDLGVQIQSFGVIVATGVLIGAALLRRYAEWHGVSDEHIRGLTGWVTVAGFIGAHVFDVLAYQWHDFLDKPLLLLEVWKGISSYGGFIGGATGFAIYAAMNRLPARLMSDITMVGLLPAFSIGRIGCSVVSDHIGAAVDPSKWYSFLAMNYPVSEHLAPVDKLVAAHGDWVLGGHFAAWNLGLIEFLYLVPVNALVLWLAFRSSKRINAGLVTVLTALLYAPVRFGLDFLRPEETDPRYFGLTFAQWASIVAFGAAVYVALRVLQHGAPAEPVTTTSGEAQQRLKTILKETVASESADPEVEEPEPAPLPKAEAKAETKAETKAKPAAKAKQKKKR